METQQTEVIALAAATREKPSDKFRQYAMENPLKFATTAIFMWGMALLLTFFLRIRYMPEVNLESVSSVLYAVAVLGLVIASYTMLALVAPGLALASFKEHFGKYASPHLACIAIAAASIWVLQLLFAFDFVSLTVMENVAFSLAIALTFASIAVICSAIIRRRTEVSFHTSLSPRVNFLTAWIASITVTAIIALVLAFPLIFILILGLGGDIRLASDEMAALQFGVLVLLIVVCALAIGLSKPTDTVRNAIFFAPTLLFMILVVTGSFSSISAMCMRALGQGEISIARISVTGSACREINQTLGQRVCAEADKDDIVAICPVIIRSRIGSQVVLDFAPIRAAAKDAQAIYWAASRKANDDSPLQSITRRVVLDKAKMLSWQPLQTIPEQNIIDKSTPMPEMATSYEFNAVVDEKTATSKPPPTKSVLAQRCGVYFAPIAAEEKKGKDKEDK
jgi:hypothetical protein